MKENQDRKKRKKLEKDLKICERISTVFCGFVESVIKHYNHNTSETHPSLITLIVQDIVIAVRRGKSMPHKHSFISTRGTWPNRFYENYCNCS